MNKKSALIYIRAPNLDYEPDKAIRLGYICKHLMDPGSFCGLPLSIPEDMETNHTSKAPWYISKGRANSGSLGIWANILQAVEPTNDYVKESVKAVAVEAVKRRQRLFMVTGVKIARGAVDSISSSRRIGGGARVEFGGESLGVPLDDGPQFNISRHIYDEETYGESSDFVFAYRVRRIVYPKGSWESTHAGSSIVNYGRYEADVGPSGLAGLRARPFNLRLQFSEGDEAEIPGPLFFGYPSTWQEVCESEGNASVQDGRAKHEVVVSPEVGYSAGSSGARNNFSSEIDGLLLGDDRFVLEEFGHEANLIPFVDDSWGDGLLISFRS
ncbi:major facilitator superfamily mfs-1 [Fusarium acutatum]|uniref:Major facilitator superfamily mfs-1 n=1 Tax=Fusarium acutatum TaxID=78861 RepID=A0A8H4JJB9_9HYPO|nr:major facilitator superfamily mfs-1 [Fusarium acutatum]